MKRLNLYGEVIMDNDKRISHELDALRKVLNYSEVREASSGACFGPGVAYFAGLFFLSLIPMIVKVSVCEFNDAERLNFLIFVVYTFLIGFLFMIFITIARSMFISLPFCYRSNSSLCRKMNDCFKHYTLNYLILHLIILGGCIFLSINGVVFITITLLLLAFSCIKLKIEFDKLKFKEIIDELNLRVTFQQHSFRVSNECDGIKNDEHNPATGLPMVGGVDVAGNPYGYSHHD